MQEVDAVFMVVGVGVGVIFGGRGGTFSCLHYHPSYLSLASRCVGCIKQCTKHLDNLDAFSVPSWRSGSCSVFSICTTASAPLGTGAPAGTTGIPYQAVERGARGGGGGGGGEDCEPQTRY